MSQAKLQPVQSIGSIEIELQLDLIDIIMSNLFVQKYIITTTHLLPPMYT